MQRVPVCLVPVHVGTRAQARDQARRRRTWPCPAYRQVPAPRASVIDRAIPLRLIDLGRLTEPDRRTRGSTS